MRRREKQLKTYNESVHGWRGCTESECEYSNVEEGEWEKGDCYVPAPVAGSTFDTGEGV